MTRQQLSNPNFYIILFIDILLFAGAHFLAYFIRFDLMTPSQEWANLWQMLPSVLVIKSLTFLGLGAYRGMWRYTSISDLMIIVEASLISSIIIFSLIMAVYEFKGFSRGVFILDWMLTVFLVGGIRLSIRRYFQKKTSVTTLFRTTPKRLKKPILIIGAGDAGEKTLREIQDNPELNYEVKGFIDDDGSKTGKSIHGIRVLGKVEDLAGVAVQEGVHDVLIAIPSGTGAQKRRILDICKTAGLDAKTLPGLGELIDGRVSVKHLRDVNYEDLLGRPPVQLDDENIRDYLKDKVVLVTGAGGSIGSELCRQIVRFSPSRLVLVDSSEPNLYQIQMELKHRVGYLDYVTILALVQDRVTMDLTMRRYQPDVIFHAAAYKHVPMLERNPWQAVRNNILAAQSIMEAAVKYHVGRFILVSTDKAVRPTNVMGASKRACERLMHAYRGGPTRMMAVRFGNVVGSAGSVIPLFQQQIEAGGPVTVTHPEVTRFFMTIPEASQLILQAGALGTGGEIFILEMGTPVKIADMARDLIRLSGKDPDRDIEIRYTSLRPGEKLYEELITEGEGIVGTAHEKILVIKSNGCFQPHTTQEAYRHWLNERLEALYNAADTYNACLIKDCLREIVPEYQSRDEECVF
jgi:FlaA1/EpsC-like NDP-sugar epimerase